MVGNGPEADEMTRSFTQYWENTAVLRNSVLVYNTGRSLGQFTSLYQEKAGALALPNVLITAVGTKVTCPHRFVCLTLYDAMAPLQLICPGMTNCQTNQNDDFGLGTDGLTLLKLGLWFCCKQCNQESAAVLICKGCCT